MNPTEDRKTVARLTTPAQIVGSIPQWLGFMPSESLVVMCLHEPRGRLGLTMRMDLPAPLDEAALVEDVLQRVQHEKATRVVMAIFTAMPDHEGDLAYRDLTVAIAAGLGGVQLTELALVRDGRFWYYLCYSEGCCPPEGTPIDAAADDSPMLLLKAEQALAGQAVLGSREELEASLAGPTGIRAKYMRSLIESIDAVPTPTTWSDIDPANLTDERAAQMAAGLHVSKEFRDKLGSREDAVDLLPLLAEVCRRTPAPYDAAVCTLYAWIAYQAGGGAVVSIALERALETDPSYLLAVLAQVPPSKLKVTS